MRGIKKLVFGLFIFIITLFNPYANEIKANEVETIKVSNVEQMNAALDKCSLGDITIELENDLSAKINKDLSTCQTKSTISFLGKNYQINGGLNLFNGYNNKVNIKFNSVNLNGKQSRKKQLSIIDINVNELSLNNTTIKNYTSLKTQNNPVIETRTINLENNSKISNLNIMSELINADNLSVIDSKITDITIDMDKEAFNTTYLVALYIFNSAKFENSEVSNVEMINNHLSTNKYLYLLYAASTLDINDSKFNDNNIDSDMYNYLCMSNKTTVKNSEFKNNIVNRKVNDNKGTILYGNEFLDIDNSQIRDSKTGNHIVYGYQRLTMRNSIIENIDSYMAGIAGYYRLFFENNLVANVKIKQQKGSAGSDYIQLIGCLGKNEDELQIYNNTFVDNETENFFMWSQWRQGLPVHHNTFINTKGGEQAQAEWRFGKVKYANIMYGYTLTENEENNKVIEKDVNINEHFERKYNQDNELIAYIPKNNQETLDLLKMDNKSSRFIAEIDYNKVYRFDKDRQDRLNTKKYINLYGADALENKNYTNTESAIIASDVEITIPYYQHQAQKSTDITIVESELDKDSKLEFKINDEKLIQAQFEEKNRVLKQNRLNINALKTGKTSILLELKDKYNFVVATKKINVKVTKQPKLTIQGLEPIEVTIPYDHDLEKEPITKTINMYIKGLDEKAPQNLICQSSNHQIKCPKFKKLKEYMSFDIEINKDKHDMLSFELTSLDQEELYALANLSVKVNRLPKPEKDEIIVDKDQVNLEIPYNQKQTTLDNFKVSTTNHYEYTNYKLECFSLDYAISDCHNTTQTRSTAKYYTYQIQGLSIGQTNLLFKMSAYDRNGKYVEINKEVEVNVTKKKEPTLDIEKNLKIQIPHNKNINKVRLKAIYHNLALDKTETIKCISTDVVSCTQNSTKQPHIFDITLQANKVGKTKVDLILYTNDQQVRKDTINIEVTKENANVLNTCSKVEKDKYKRITKEIICHRNGKIARVFTYSYLGNTNKLVKKDKKYFSVNNSKRLIKQEIYSNYLNNKQHRKLVVINKTDNKNNRVNKRVETTLFNNKKLKQQTIKTYHSNGNLKTHELVRFNKKAKRTKTLIKTYFKNKRLELKKDYVYQDNGKVKKRNITHYFNEKRLMQRFKEVTTFNKKGHKVKKLQYRYNKKGKLISNKKRMKAWRVRIDYKNNKAVKTRLNHYNAKGQLK